MRDGAMLLRGSPSFTPRSDSDSIGTVLLHKIAGLAAISCGSAVDAGGCAGVHELSTVHASVKASAILIPAPYTPPTSRCDVDRLARSDAFLRRFQRSPAARRPASSAHPPPRT